MCVVKQRACDSTVGFLKSRCLALVVDLLGLDWLTRCSALELGYLWIGFPALRAASGCNLIFHIWKRGKGGATLRSYLQRNLRRYLQRDLQRDLQRYLQRSRPFQGSPASVLISFGLIWLFAMFGKVGKSFTNFAGLKGSTCDLRGKQKKHSEERCM